MKSLMKKVIMGVLALAIVMTGVVSNPEMVKAGIDAKGTGWDDGTWVFKIISEAKTEEILVEISEEISEDRARILRYKDVIYYKPDTKEYNAKLLYSYSNVYNESTELFIGKNAFISDDYRVKTVTIETEREEIEGFSNPAGELNIGEKAFNACPELTEIKCQSNVKIKTINQCAFEGCGKLKTIDLTEVETIGKAAFYACNHLEKIKFNKVKSIGYWAFSDCRSLQEVDFGDWDVDTACNIDDSAFVGVGSEGGENNPVLKLPANWPEGDLPTKGGDSVKWHGGYFDYSPIESISLNKSSTTLVVGENESLVATVVDVPDKTENKAVTWTSSDETVATVDATGKVKAVAAGETTITATSKLDDRREATCTVTVLPKYEITVESGEHGSAKASEKKAQKGKEVTLKATPGEGYLFDKWVDATGVDITDATSNPLTFSMPNNAISIKATFKLAPPDVYAITVESGDHGKARADKTEAAEGTEVILTAIPDEGYEFDAWISEDVTVTNNKFTMPAKNTIVKAVFKQVEPPEEPESPTPEDPESPTPEEPESPTPEDPIADQEITIGNLEDLSSVIEAIKSITDNGSTEETPVVTLKMENGVTKVTKEVFEALQENDNAVVIVLDMGNYKWTIDSADITGTPTDIDFSVKIGDEAETIEIDVINEVTGKEEKKSINISLTHSGDFKCKPTLTVNVEEENKGYYANLFYYNPSTKKLEYVCAGRIKPNGDVDLKFPHASDYAIIISDKDMNPDNSAKNESKKSDKKKEEKKDKNKEAVYVDYDTMKSELAAGTVLMFDLNDLTKFKDMKVFTPDKTVMANQKFLADYYAGQMGKKAKILHTYNVHPKSDLQIGEAGTKKMFAWNNLAIKTPGAIYAVCYNQKDGAYLLSGTLDNKGTAILPYFIMNEATTVTLFTVE